MGITIHYAFVFYREDGLNNVLEKAKKLAEELGMAIVKYENTAEKKALIISPHPNCENICLVFEKWDSIKKRLRKDVWDYVYEVIKLEFNEKSLDGNYFVCAGFTKTQFAGDITHIKVAEVLRLVSAYANKVSIYDEGEYYETLNRERLLELFGQIAKGIKIITNILREMGYEVECGYDRAKDSTT